MNEFALRKTKYNAWRWSESAMHRITYTRWPAFCVHMSRPKTTMALSFIVIYCHTHAALSRLMNREHQGKGWNGIYFVVVIFSLFQFIRTKMSFLAIIYRSRTGTRTYILMIAAIAVAYHPTDKSNQSHATQAEKMRDLFDFWYDQIRAASKLEQTKRVEKYNREIEVENSKQLHAIFFWECETRSQM